MMREKKFRAWDKRDNKMVYGISEMKKLWDEDIDYLINDSDEWTGLKDKERTDIYEFDIVTEPYFSNVNPNDHNDNDDNDDLERLYVICYDSNQARYKSVPISLYKANAGNGGWTGYEVKYERIIVIGNIHATPELLEKV